MKVTRRSSMRTLAGLSAAALALAAPSAFASTSQVTVHANGFSTGTIGFFGATTGTPGVNFTAGTSPMECASATASGDPAAGPGTNDGGLHLGASSFGVDIAEISSSTWSGCTALSGSVNMAVTQNGVWQINSGDPTSATVTPLTITNVNAHVQDTTYGGAVCNFDVVGSVDGFFDESDQTLHVTAPTGVAMAPFTSPAGLTLQNVTADCLGSIATNDPATFIGTYLIGALASPHASLNIDITQP